MRALGFLVSFALLPACADDHEDRDYQLIVYNNGNVAVDVWITDGMWPLEEHYLGPFEVATLWLSEETLKDHPRLIIRTHSGDDELVDFTLHRSYFTDWIFRVTVYP